MENGAARATPEERLRQAHSLHNLGLLSKEEFEEIKSGVVRELKTGQPQHRDAPAPPDHAALGHDLAPGLAAWDIERFSRQMLVESFGPEGQRRVKECQVVVVGVGGLGCPVCLYLAGMGIGVIGVVDEDVVEESNLHRQIAHSEGAVGTPKVDSMRTAVHRLCATTTVHAHNTRLTSANALDILRPYDIVVDCSDNVPTRYLLSDACVVLGKPLVCGAAVGTEGQVTVYNHNRVGPCMRCLFPSPPSAPASCADAGVLGVVPGIVGCLQALEVVKVCVESKSVLSGKMTILDALGLGIRSMGLPNKKRPGCWCGGGQCNEDHVRGTDYAAFAEPCGAKPPSPTPRGASDANDGEEDSLEPPPPKRQRPNGVRGPSVPTPTPTPSRLQPREYGELRRRGDSHLLLDVRSPTQFAMCALHGAVPLPLERLQQDDNGHHRERVAQLAQEKGGRVVVVCRRGIRSFEAVQLLRQAGVDAVDVRGGLNAWARDVDAAFPFY